MAAIFFVLISSCPVKFNIKKLINDPVQTTQSSGEKVDLFSGNNQALCTECAVIETTVIQEKTSVQPLDLLSGLFPVLLTAFPFNEVYKKDQVPLLKHLSSLPYSIPIYLHHRSLII